MFEGPVFFNVTGYEAEQKCHCSLCNELLTTTTSHDFLQRAWEVETLAFGGREQNGDWERKEPKNLQGRFSVRIFLSVVSRIKPVGGWTGQKPRTSFNILLSWRFTFKTKEKHPSDTTFSHFTYLAIIECEWESTQWPSILFLTARWDFLSPCCR